MKTVRLLQALSASAALIASPSFAQVSSALLGTTTGTGVVGNALESLRQGATTAGGASTGGRVGTFTLSASEGTNQNFAVGTSTNLGINASASSTSEYQVQSNSTLGLSGSNFKQVIGTSGTTENLATRTQALTDYKAQAVQTEVGSSVDSYIDKAVAMKASGKTDAQVQQTYAWWDTKYSGKTSSEVNSLASSSEKTAISSDYSQKVDTINQRAQSEFSSTSSFSDAANGIIRGSFNASEVSNVDAGTKTTTVTNTNWAATAAATGVTQRDAGTQTVTAVEASESASNSVKNNTVVVGGIGNTANVNAGSSSQFTTAVTARSAVTAPTSNSATANGGAGASISSTSNANASNSSFASVFVQSF